MNKGKRRYAETYREAEIRQLTGWIETGMSGSVVGLAGSGKSNLLSVLNQQPQRLTSHLTATAPPVALIFVDLSYLLNAEVGTLYRLILRALYDSRSQFDAEMESVVVDQYELCRTAVDPVVTQNGVRDLLQVGSERQMRLVFLLNQFDRFCEMATPAMTNSLRGLRDGFKAYVCYVVEMRQPVTRLPDAVDLGNLYELLDLHTLWLGPMTAVSSYQMIRQEMRLLLPDVVAADVEMLYQIAGGFPALIKAVCRWWVRRPELHPAPEWIPQLLQDAGVQHRLNEIWSGLDGEEQRGLQAFVSGVEFLDEAIWERLLQTGVCVEGKSGLLLRGFVQTAVYASSTSSPDSLRLDELSGNIYKGDKRLADLPPLEHSVLTYMLQNPEVRLTKNDIIENGWPEEDVRFGVRDDSLYQVVNSLRKHIESTSSPNRYLVTWRGKPGGYQLFPNGDGGG